MFGVRDIIRAAQDQGWRVEETTHGWMFYPADKGKRPISWHKTPSDQRAYQNFRSLMRGAGFKWPGKD